MIRDHSEEYFYLSKEDMNYIECLASGWNDSEIALELGRSVEEVKAVINRIRLKFGLVVIPRRDDPDGVKLRHKLMKESLHLVALKNISYPPSHLLK